MFKKILIANRGEIAVRVIRACHEMGIAAVAMYSEVDRASLHVRKADEAYPIGPASAKESYLNIDKIISVAEQSGADAIHPGYGFLSENAQFARACADGGVKFIGPTAAAMDAMGSKTRARQAMEKAGVPFVPGTSRGVDSFEEAQAVAERIGYLVDQQKNFYFLEMNTRLQVEHPITELVTGLDLVHLQIHIANGEPLPFQQDDVNIRGHAIECRIYAEDPDNNYFPSPGKITLLLAPSGPGIRRDSGMYEGWTVPIDYDPLLAKLIGYGTDRKQAIGRLVRALNEYFVGGIKTNISLFRRILNDAEFHAGKLQPGFLDRLLARPRADSSPDESAAQVAAIAAGVFAMLDPGTPAVYGANAAG